MKKTLKQLQAEHTEIINKSRELREKISALILQKELPKLRKKYEGKFWKYQNSCSGDQKWWLYSYCRKVEDEREAVFDTFESTPYTREFKSKDRGFFHLCEKEISKEEYLSELKNFQLLLGEFFSL
jgi:hypothetical protein